MNFRNFEQALLEFARLQGRKSLPWRKENISPYEVWVSEIMLQQTQVNRVIDYFERFLKKFPHIFLLAQSSWEEFLPYYAGLGYYRRGQNMLKTAKILVDEYNGIFPKNKEKLLQLPGIGDYTASAILSFGYGENHLAFDTNLQRVFGRYIYGNKKAVLPKNEIDQSIEANKKILNGAIMDFANLICSNNPKCHNCPLQKDCQYFQENGKQEIAPKKEKKTFPTRDAQVHLWLHKDHKEYYSPNPDNFEVFILSSQWNSRESIKQYFRSKYGLELAVRPPHKKIFIKDTPTLFVNAQILSGNHFFGIFKKEEINENNTY